ncbi:MAG TPA: hypothetical protein VF244_01695 [Acidimicrobiales bacterium]
MALPQTAPTPSAVEAMAPELGMRRVRWVTISIGDDGVRAEVAGLAHRFPITRPVTLQTANRLIRAGCPYVVRRTGRATAQATSGPSGS